MMSREKIKKYAKHFYQKAKKTDAGLDEFLKYCIISNVLSAVADDWYSYLDGTLAE